MEFKGIYVMLMIMVILFIGTGNATDEECADRCQYLCGDDGTCFYRCVIACPGVAQQSAEGHHESHDQQYYCKLGCSNECLKYNNDKVKTERCMDNCIYETCNIKPGAPPNPVV